MRPKIASNNYAIPIVDINFNLILLNNINDTKYYFQVFQHIVYLS